MIGLKRGTVKLYQHEKAWEAEAVRTVADLKSIFGELAHDIQHIGSTSISSALAKPIIDIAVGVDSLDCVDAKLQLLAEKGFILCQDESATDELLFVCGSDGLQTHFVHVVKYGGDEWHSFVDFRDYLHKNPLAASDYDSLRQRLANKNPENRAAYAEGKDAFIKKALRRSLADSYLGKTVTIKIDRPIGYEHKKKDYTLHYPINYGYIPGVIGGDGEELDVYLLGVDEPVDEYTCRIIGAVYRLDDVEDKLVGVPQEVKLNQAQIAEAIDFQEKYHESEVDAIYEKSCGAVVWRSTPRGNEYLCLLQRRSNTYSVPKGHALAFESEEQTAKREIREETGANARLVPGFRRQLSYVMSGGRQKTVTLFLAELTGKIRLDHREIKRYVWASLDDAKRLLPGGYSSVLDDAEAFVSKKDAT